MDSELQVQKARSLGQVLWKSGTGIWGIEPALRAKTALTQSPVILTITIRYESPSFRQTLLSLLSIRYFIVF